MSILIVGTGGYIGHYLYKALKKNDVYVVGVSSSDGSGINPNTGRIVAEFSIPTGTESIVYLAQSPYYRQVQDKSDHLMAVNVFSAIQIANLARKANVKRFISLRVMFINPVLRRFLNKHRYKEILAENDSGF